MIIRFLRSIPQIGPYGIFFSFPFFCNYFVVHVNLVFVVQIYRSCHRKSPILSRSVIKIIMIVYSVIHLIHSPEYLASTFCHKYCYQNNYIYPYFYKEYNYIHAVFLGKNYKIMAQSNDEGKTHIMNI